jgi:hypothetical protein
MSNVATRQILSMLDSFLGYARIVKQWLKLTNTTGTGIERDALPPRM